MDEKPFLEFNITDIKDNQIEKLKEFHKSYFNLDSISTTASELKFMNEIRQIINRDINEPTDEFVKYFAKQTYPSMVTAKVLEQFKMLVKKSFQLYFNDLLNDRLKSAMTKDDDKNGTPDIVETMVIEENKNRVKVTTEEEIQAYYVVCSILRLKVPVSRISYRDSQSYFAIFLDDNNRKPICRLYLEGSKKYLATIDADKKEIKHEIKNLTDIYTYSSILETTLHAYLTGDNKAAKEESLANNI
jgi:hypothetical protein